MAPQNRAVVIIDDRPLRREAYVSLLTPWALQKDLQIISSDLLVDKMAGDQTALVIISPGARSITELRWRSQFLTGFRDKPPAVVISDLDDPGEIAAALRLGIRAFMPTALTGELALETLSFVLSGGEFFPISALQARAEPKVINGEES